MYPARMLCPHCRSESTRVVDSRPADQGAAIRRRRECLDCESRFTTYERVDAPVTVRKRDGTIEPFDLSKVVRGMGAALADRPVESAAVSRVVEEIEDRARSNSGPVDAELIGRWVLDGLRSVDEVAYLRFASVYKEFEGAADFEREMAELEATGSRD